MEDAAAIFRRAVKLKQKKKPLVDDSEEIDSPPNELADLIANPLGMINIKSAIVLFCLFLFISSNVFIDQFLKKFDGTARAGQLTMKAIIIQATVLVLLFIVFEILAGYNLI